MLAILLAATAAFAAALTCWLWMYGSVHWFAGPDRPASFAVPPPVTDRIGPGLPRFRPVEAAGRRWVADRFGRAVSMRGAILEYDPDNPPPFEALAARGFNAVRLLIPWRVLEPHPGATPEEAVSGVAAVLDLASRHRFLVILANTLATGSTRPAAVEAPGWAFRRGIGDDADMGDPEGVFTSLTGLPGAARFQRDFLLGSWSPDDVTLQDHIVGVWVCLARRFRNHPALAGLDPFGASTCPDGWTAGLLMDRPSCVSATREFDERFNAFLQAVDPGLLLVRGAPGAATASLHAAARIALRVADIDPAAAWSFVPLSSALSSAPSPLPERVAGKPVSFGPSAVGGGSGAYTLTFRQGDYVADSLVILPGGPAAFGVEVSDGRAAWSKDRNAVVWTANPAIHTHRMDIRPINP